MKNAVNWVEIPALDFNRSKLFYETIFGSNMQTMEAMGMKSAFFNFDMQNGGIGGCIITGAGYEPSEKGSLVYLNGGIDLQDVLSKVEAAGGKVVLPKTAIGGNGFMAHFIDTEGNKVGLHSRV
ncbi:MAG: VOC family protein [Bacteroidia bacterium]|nr:VOC family protein [Bacteroidia bacterium]MCF8428244.1 VOC family protein [Bacteroidia bacterium]MCF8448187.1 VOC family protein [Bacteroidia bacterium]